MPHIDSPLQEPHPRHASATIVTTEREYIPHMPPTRNILPRGSPHKRTPIGHHAGGSAVWDRPRLVIVVHHNACAECPVVDLIQHGKWGVHICLQDSLI